MYDVKVRRFHVITVVIERQYILHTPSVQCACVVIVTRELSGTTIFSHTIS